MFKNEMYLLKRMNRIECKGLINEDIKRYVSKKNIGILSFIKCFLIYRGFRTVYFYRKLHHHSVEQHRIRHFLWYILDLVVNKNTIISDGAIIGPGLLLVHPLSIVIGQAQIGNYCTIYQNVTIGANYKKDVGGRQYPIIGDNVRLSPGAAILGPITIGSRVIVGANSVVMKDVPSNSVIAGVPAKIIGNYDLSRFDPP